MMETNVNKFTKLNELVTLANLRKPKIVLNPSGEYCINTKRKNEEEYAIDLDIVFDKIAWEIPEEVKSYIKELRENDNLSNEEKILAVYKRLCEMYIYDDNVLSYIKKVDIDKFALPDWYGRDIDSNWVEAREKHNKRVCYEVSRYLAKALTELFDGNPNYNACILWDVDLTHYFVGLSSRDYILTLDLDDFNNIKDLTRQKTGLTLEGIRILEDPKNIFKMALDKYNKTREKHAIKKSSTDIAEDKRSEEKAKSESIDTSQKEENLTVEGISEEIDKLQESDEIIFMREAVEQLVKRFNLDSQGLFEYMKEIVDMHVGASRRQKVWKKLDSDPKNGPKYTRCLIICEEEGKYIIDSDERIVRKFDEKEYEQENAKFIPFKKLSRDWEERDNGL